MAYSALKSKKMQLLARKYSSWKTRNERGCGMKSMAFCIYLLILHWFYFKKVFHLHVDNQNDERVLGVLSVWFNRYLAISSTIYRSCLLSDTAITRLFKRLAWFEHKNLFQHDYMLKLKQNDNSTLLTICFSTCCITMASSSSPWCSAFWSNVKILLLVF